MHKRLNVHARKEFFGKSLNIFGGDVYRGRGLDQIIIFQMQSDLRSSSANFSAGVHMRSDSA